MPSRHEFDYNRGYDFDKEKEEPKKIKNVPPMPEDRIDQELEGWEDFKNDNNDREDRWSK